MVLIGKLTKDAIVSIVKDKKVVNFTVAVNDSYKSKGSNEWKTYTSFFNCAYWINTGVAPLLKKGCLVEVTGRIYVSAYKNMEETAKASLHCHASAIKIHTAKKKEDNAELIQKEVQDDLPF